MRRRPFVPALGFRFLTRLYDPLIRLTMREQLWKERLIDQAGIQPGQRVLDLGCGTGTLDLLIKSKHPDVDVVGLEPDPEILAIARKKASKSGAGIRFDMGYADQLPYPDASFDRVVSSLVFHHLRHNAKVRAFGEVVRVLRPHGELHLADIGRPSNAIVGVAAMPLRLIDGVGATQDNLAGRLPAMMADAGFSEVTETGRLFLGAVCLYRASKPAD